MIDIRPTCTIFFSKYTTVLKIFCLNKPVNVERGDNLRKGEVLSNGTRDAHLINGQVGVRGDDGTGGEVHSLSHQIPPDTPLFGL